jgi:hypothetical protein
VTLLGLADIMCPVYWSKFTFTVSKGKKAKLDKGKIIMLLVLHMRA